MEQRLAAVGGELAGEQAHAIRVACGASPLVVIVGQAGTGKSTALVAIARAHQAAGQRVIVTSTGALAAERLADELLAAGVDAEGFSTAALHAQITGGSIQLSPGVTVIHDEAALASTREQDRLLGAVEQSGTRLIMVGDPRQSQAVGAGGLWPRIAQAAKDRGAWVELSRIVRAHDPADRRDQSLWRAGQHDRALAGYAARGRLVVDDSQPGAEDRALEAAQADRQAGRSTLVITQTSNEQLDALNARAQALRWQAGELGPQEVPLAGRPYGLRAGDEIQVRHPLQHPDLGRISNGTTGQVLDVDPDGQVATLQLGDSREPGFDRTLLDVGQTRLSYVQHPFPAQGATADTAHVIAGEHATAEGSYVALTRARQHTRIYVGQDRVQLADHQEAGAGQDMVVAELAERLGRSEPEVPSIALPLAYEQHVVDELDRASALDAREHTPDVDIVQEKQRGLKPEGSLSAPLPAAGPKATQHEISGFEQRRARRDQLRTMVDTYPAEVVGQVQALRAQARQEQESPAGDERRAEHWQQASDELGVLGRRGREGRERQERAQRFAEQAGEHRHRGDRLLAQAQALTAGPAGPQGWEQTHPGAREDLYAAEQALAEAVRERARARERGQRPGQLAGGLGEEIRWLTGERDRLTDELGSYPVAQARAVEQAERRAQQALQERQAAHQHAHQAERELDELGPLARRGQQAARLRQRIDQQRQHAERLQAQEREQREQARRGWEAPGGPAELERAHPGVRERLAIYEHAHGQAGLEHTAELIVQATQAPRSGSKPV